MAVEYLTFYQDSFRGGVTGSGVSLPHLNGAYSGTFTLNIAPGSTINKAFLLVGRHGWPQPINVNFNGSPAPFNPSNQIVPNFYSFYGGVGSVHVKDVTNLVSASNNVYTITVPFQIGPDHRFEDFYLYVTFKNPLLPYINTYVFINKLGFNTPTLSYPLSFVQPINAAKPVALALMCGYMCVNGEGNSVSLTTSLGNNTLGNIFGPNPNTPPCPICSTTCAGPHGDFSHYNNILTGFNGSSNNLNMATADVLSNIQSRLTTGDTAFTVNSVPQNPPNITNSTWALFVSYANRDNIIYECQNCGEYSVSNLFSTTARLNWYLNCVNPLPLSYINTVQYRPVGNSTWTSVNVTNTSYLDITNLLPGTNYEWQVVNLDFGGTQCAPGPILYFQTP